MRLIWKPFDRQFRRIIQNFRKHAETVDTEARLAHMLEASEDREMQMAERDGRKDERQREYSVRPGTTLRSGC